MTSCYVEIAPHWLSFCALFLLYSGKRCTFFKEDF